MSAPALENPAAEESVLGAILLDERALARIRPVLPSPAAFTRREHAELYRAVLGLSDRHAPIDPVTLQSELGPAYADRFGALVAELVDATVTTARAEYHAGLVLDAWRRRLLQAEAARLQQCAADPALAVGDVVADLTTRLVGVAGDDPLRPQPSLAQIFCTTLENLEHQVTEHVAIRGVPTGFPTLDRMTDGLRPTQLAILAARPGEGKSSLASRIGTRAAAHGPVYWVSLEMSEEELVERILQEAVGCDMRKLRREPGMLDRYVARLSHHSGRLSQLPLRIECETRSPARLRLQLLGEIAQGRKPALVIVDYLQLMEADRPQQNRDREIGEITKALKRIGMELGLPILLLSQLTRLSAKENRPPELYDLRDSGNIEQDANLVLMIHWPNGDPPGEVEVDLYVRKNRGGPKGKVELRFEPWTQRWREYMQPMDDPRPGELVEVA